MTTAIIDRLPPDDVIQDYNVDDYDSPEDHPDVINRGNLDN
eukprot:CAMPEP_0185622792 /NCGR_PEP_ID=MMETSP0436-20130131/59444_1 /TAXON_ID=626734 ORGANISM="Favella taraikaensis, Strain Fe Narragansett Bay" /NCGR_SAMPLE_ID=MMETSP0436 /ASSEMBLY_ACC=CAM_ASM_000390 /LENGTH=40 /DNA_ID= /DNA_START= /DNA_END= /DNA_ORIENTATION=